MNATMISSKKIKRQKPISSLRREILIGSGCVVGLLCLGAVTKTSEASSLIRPPGTVFQEFASLCLKCGRCVAACHTKVLTLAGVSEGVMNLRTPVMDYLHGYCDFCSKCIDVCPTGALKPFEGKTTVVGLAELNDSCIALRTGGCTKCYEECSYDAITLDAMGRPEIHQDLCNGCGKCVYVCPAHVFQSFSSGAQRGISVRALESESTKRTA